MAYDPVHRWQLRLRRAGKYLRGRGILIGPGKRGELAHASNGADPARARGQRYLQSRGPDPELPAVPAVWRRDADTRARFFATGRKRCANMLAAIEAQTGVTLDSPRALDFGCGVGRFTMPLAERCAHVYGVDLMPSVLSEAKRNAEHMNFANVELLQTARLAELSGRYDLVLSVDTFQHIPTREGERIFATLVQGLRPGGVAAIDMPVRPDHPLGELVRWSLATLTSPSALRRGRDSSYPYMLMNSYSLNRVGRLLADAGIVRWDARFTRRKGHEFDVATIFLRKPDVPGAGAGSDSADESRSAIGV